MIDPDELARRDHRALDHRLEDPAQLPLGPVRGIGDDVFGAVLHLHAIDHVGCGGDQVQVELALQALAGDLHVQQAQEAAAEAEAQRHRGLGGAGERGVVELQLVQGVAQVRIVRAIDRIQARVDHRTRFAVTGKWICRAVAGGGDGIADLRLAHVLHAGDEIAHLADAQALRGLGLRGHDADLQQFVRGAGGHHLDLLTRGQLAVDHADVGDHAAIGVVDRVEDHGAGRGVRLAPGRRDLRNGRVRAARARRRRSYRTPAARPRARTRRCGRSPRRIDPDRPPVGRSC